MTGRYTLYGFKLTGSCAIEAALAVQGRAQHGPITIEPTL